MTWFATPAELALFTPEFQQANLLAVAVHVLDHPETLDMDQFHAITSPDQYKALYCQPLSPDRGSLAMAACGTVHCLAGHAICNTGPEGFELAYRVGDFSAGAMLLGAEAASHFYDADDEALDFLREVIERHNTRIGQARRAAEADAALLPV
jgi:hypothetical protein